MLPADVTAQWLSTLKTSIALLAHKLSFLTYGFWLGFLSGLFFCGFFTDHEFFGFRVWRWKFLAALCNCVWGLCFLFLYHLLRFFLFLNFFKIPFLFSFFNRSGRCEVHVVRFVLRTFLRSLYYIYLIVLHCWTFVKVIVFGYWLLTWPICFWIFTFIFLIFGLLF